MTQSRPKNKLTEDDKSTKIDCTNCDREFKENSAYQVYIRGPNSAEYTCPWCKRTVYTSPPENDIDRPPEVVSKSQKTDGEGLTTAKMTFKNGSWLQYRETSDGWVREEMYNELGHEVESFKAEINKEDCDPAIDHRNRAVKRYKKYTKTGLRIQRPHIAAVLLHRF